MTLEAAERIALARVVVESVKGGYGGATAFRTRCSPRATESR
jgi:hypothetical protein